ncbi:family 88 glycosyl hydrolase [Croceivirga radicis]|uniref:Family 88 glycosyl hydrolase n=1 Tax=Croceivirga radicis TaxID=1929488 RepID=A0A1V6LP93_9FLAO|nr:glycoside hydrolase family 88 protein [Croceivirga radicis]OQD42025.1 family 88 glycosyl hydrolase [Croceivirga radicis]
MNKTKKLLPILCLCCLALSAQQKMNDATAPLHLMQPQYDYPYGVPDKAKINSVLSKVHAYLESTTPTTIVDKNKGKEITDFKNLEKAANLTFGAADFRLVSYEWGVTYAGMLLATQATKNPKYANYTNNRISFLADLYPNLQKWEKKHPEGEHPMHTVLHPNALDDAGAICAAMLKAKREGLDAPVDPMVNNFIDYISNKQLRLLDGTLARNRPMKNSLWLDDLFMSVPALAQMGAYTNNNTYFDDATQQVLQFAERMFVPEKGLFMHAYIMDMESHPTFYWGRANGWAVMTMVELLEVLPKEHKNYNKVLELLRKHISGLAKLQSANGLWHQLLDKNDSYLETSASAIFTYAMARAINRGYIDAKAYGPAVCLAWNAVAEQVNEKGQVTGTCVGTGMGFDPAFYYYRPVNVYAAHGYGPVLLAGAEVLLLLQNAHPKMNDSAVQFYDKPVKTTAPIFSVDE